MDRPKNRSYIPAKFKKGFVVWPPRERATGATAEPNTPSEMNQPKRPKQITGWTIFFFLGTVLALLGHAGTSYDEHRETFALFAIAGAVAAVINVRMNDHL